MAFDPLHFRFTQAAIGSPEEEAGTAAQAATPTATPLSQVAIQKGMLITLDEVLTALETGVSSTASFTDDTAHTPGTTKTQPIAGTYRSSRDTLDDNDAGTIALNQRRGVYVTLEAADSTPLALAAGAVSAATLRVISASDDPAVTSLAIIDDWDESDRAKVNPIVGQAGVAAGAGSVSATTQRVTHASDDPVTTALQLIDDTIFTDDAAYTPGTSKLLVIGAQADEAAPDSVDEGDAGALRMTLARGLHVNLRNSSGTETTYGAGSVSTATQRVTLASDDPVTTAVQIMDDWDESDRAKVNPIVGQAGVAAGSGSNGATVQRVTIATDDTVMGGTADAAATAGSTGSISAKLRAISRDIVANIVLAAGTNLIGRAVADASAATGGIPSTARLLSAAGSSGDATNVKASAGRVYAIQGANVATSARYLKLYNSASAPTAGAGTPVKTIYLPPQAAFAFDWPLGLTFATGIGFTLVTGSADNSSSSVTAGDILALNIDYA